jgi:hypothetical protein
MDKQTLGEIWTSDEPWRNLAYLCDDLGHRFAGSEREHEAAAYLRDRMLAYGLEKFASRRSRWRAGSEGRVS